MTFFIFIFVEMSHILSSIQFVKTIDVEEYKRIYINPLNYVLFLS